MSGTRWSSPGGDGTPAVREFCVPELAMARQTHPAPRGALMADVLDLRHRLPAHVGRVPRARVRALGGPQGRRRCPARTGRRSVGLVDRAVAGAIAGHAPQP